jgi:hypothetical protein
MKTSGEIFKQAWRHCQRADFIVGSWDKLSAFSYQPSAFAFGSVLHLNALLSKQNNGGCSKRRSNKAAGEAGTAGIPSGVR